MHGNTLLKLIMLLQQQLQTRHLYTETKFPKTTSCFGYEDRCNLLEIMQRIDKKWHSPKRSHIQENDILTHNIFSHYFIRIHYPLQRIWSQFAKRWPLSRVQATHHSVTWHICQWIVLQHTWRCEIETFMRESTSISVIWAMVPC
jgi:hypothetical protein